MQNPHLKVFTIIVLGVLLAAFFLMVFRKISPLLFWIIVIICAIIAYKVIPYIKNRI